MDTATPTPPKAAVRAVAPVTAVILDVSSAFVVTLPASITVNRSLTEGSLSINALTSVVIVFTATAPAPPTLTPTEPPETPATPATTSASMD